MWHLGDADGDVPAGTVFVDMNVGQYSWDEHVVYDPGGVNGDNESGLFNWARRWPGRTSITYIMIALYEGHDGIYW